MWHAIDNEIITLIIYDSVIRIMILLKRSSWILLLVDAWQFRTTILSLRSHNYLTMCHKNAGLLIYFFYQIFYFCITYVSTAFVHISLAWLLQLLSLLQYNLYCSIFQLFKLIILDFFILLFIAIILWYSTNMRRWNLLLFMFRWPFELKLMIFIWGVLLVLRKLF